MVITGATVPDGIGPSNVTVDAQNSQCVGLYFDPNGDGVLLKYLPRGNPCRVACRSTVPFYTTWNIGRSNTRPLKQNGAVVGSVFEPRSETCNYGIQINAGFTF
jgi:hypothetical protein